MPTTTGEYAQFNPRSYTQMLGLIDAYADAQTEFCRGTASAAERREAMEAMKALRESIAGYMMELCPEE